MDTTALNVKTKLALNSASKQRETFKFIDTPTECNYETADALHEATKLIVAHHASIDNLTRAHSSLAVAHDSIDRDAAVFRSELARYKATLTSRSDLITKSVQALRKEQEEMSDFIDAASATLMKFDSRSQKLSDRMSRLEDINPKHYIEKHQSRLAIHTSKLRQLQSHIDNVEEGLPIASCRYTDSRCDRIDERLDALEDIDLLRVCTDLKAKIETLETRANRAEQRSITDRALLHATQEELRNIRVASRAARDAAGPPSQDGAIEAGLLE